jgi:hypothetical protein
VNILALGSGCGCGSLFLRSGMTEDGVVSRPWKQASGRSQPLRSLGSLNWFHSLMREAAAPAQI